MKKKLRRTVEALKAYEPDKIYLFGSWAKGEEDELSDMGFMLIKKIKMRLIHYHGVLIFRKNHKKTLHHADSLDFSC
jgi:predicted nucleotidyltransferase